MSAWRRRAIEAAPELSSGLEMVWSPMAVWIELRIYFETLVETGEMEKAGRIMDYARWCFQSRSPDIFTAVTVAFIEHLGENDAVRACLPDLITHEEGVAWRDIMLYHSDDETLDALLIALKRKRWTGALPRNV